MAGVCPAIRVNPLTPGGLRGMRGKIIAVFALVVLVVGGLSYGLTRATLGDLSTPGEAPRALAAADRLQLDGLLLERWIAVQATNPKLREPFTAGDPASRPEKARGAADQMKEAIGAAPEFAAIAVPLVVFVDKNGVVLSRNGSPLMRGDDLGAVYPRLKEALAKGMSGSDVWVNRARNEQMLASYAPIRDADGTVLGGLAIGTALNDERLTTAGERTSGKMIVAGVKDNAGLDVVAKAKGTPDDVAAALAKPPARDAALQALGSNQVVDVGGLPLGYTASAHAVGGYGDGHRMVLVSVARLQAPAILSSLLWPAIGAIVLGLILVAVGAHFLDAYISRPISELEDGLLAIMNGRTDRRFEIEHAELGGLVFRLNSLLNQLLGVQEDETDDQGRPSRAPAASSFQDPLTIDESMAGLSGEEMADAQALREEPAEAYYQRIHEEYVRARSSLGDSVDHITMQAFIDRLKVSENEMSAKHGKPVRYKVEVRGKEVVLLAVPLV
jgi:hypothetical protein